MSGPLTVLRGGAAAVVFLTRVPITVRLRQSDWRWASAWFPIVGGALGAFLAACWWTARPLGAWPAAILTVVAAVLATGALHEDGLADTADALGGSDNRAKIFAILKDSRIGTYGATALVLALLLRVSLVVQIGMGAPAILVASHTIARLCPALMLATLPYVTPADVSKSSAAVRPHPACASVAVATTAAIVAFLCVGEWLTVSAAATILAVSTLTTILLARYFVHRLGGVTGDLLGATEQTVECAVLVTAAAVAPPQ